MYMIEYKGNERVWRESTALVGEWERERERERERQRAGGEKI